jgi:hypothetical protein
MYSTQDFELFLIWQRFGVFSVAASHIENDRPKRGVSLSFSAFPDSGVEDRTSINRFTGSACVGVRRKQFAAQDKSVEPVWHSELQTR